MEFSIPQEEIDVQHIRFRGGSENPALIFCMPGVFCGRKGPFQPNTRNIHCHAEVEFHNDANPPHLQNAEVRSILLCHGDARF